MLIWMDLTIPFADQVLFIVDLITLFFFVENYYKYEKDTHYQI